MKLRVGCRDSILSVAQAEIVLAAIRSYDPAAEIELVTMKTTGDKILDRPLDKIGGRGLFVRELDDALRQGRVDLTVHSCKDLPLELPADLPIVAVTRREDPRDALVLPAGVSALAGDKPIGSSSLRRRLALSFLYPQMAVQSVRGNVQTRLHKLDTGGYAALVLAAAGLKRLGLAGRVHRYFSPEEMLPAAGQGMIAVQARAGEAFPCLQAVNDPSAAACALAERAFVRTLGGGCTSPVAAYAVTEGPVLTLTGMDESGARERITGPAAAAERLGVRLADRFLERRGRV